jgi:acetyl esterase/lipase
VAHQVLEERELLGCEFDGVLAATNAPRRGIEDEVADREDRRARGARTATEERAQTREELGERGSLAARVALEEELVDAGDLGGVSVRIRAALFLYGLFSYSLLMERPGSQLGAIEVMGNLAYLGETFLSHHKNPLVSPILAPRPSHFPPSYFAVGDEDSLLPHSLAMVDKLAAANVPTTLSVVAGMDHAFLMLEHLFVDAREEMERIARWLRRTFSIEPAATV